MADDDVRKALGPTSTIGETALDITGAVLSIAPYLGGPVQAVLSGVSFGRKLGRVREVLVGVAEDLRGFKSEATEKYVQRDEFHELLEHTLRQASEERSDEKRRLYRSFLTGAIKVPGPTYDKQIEILRVIEQIQVDHVRVLAALAEPPDPMEDGLYGSVLQTLSKRLSGFSRDQLTELVERLNALRLTTPRGLTTMMTAQGAADLRSMISPFGRKFMQHISAD